MQSKVLCIVFVTLVASSVTTASLSDLVKGVVKGGQDVINKVSNAANSSQSLPQISLPSTPNIGQLNVSQGIEAAEQLLGSALGSVGNLVDTIQNVVTAALKGAQPLVDLINLLTQILSSFSKAAADNPLETGLLILNNGLQLIQNILRAVIPSVMQGVATII